MYRYIRDSIKTVHQRHLLPDLAIILFCIYASLFLRVGTDYANLYLGNLHKYVPLILGVRIIVFTLFRTYNILWRYVSAKDVVRLSTAFGISSVAIVSLSFLFTDEIGIPRSLFLIEPFLSLVGLMGIRILRRLKYESRHYKQLRHGKRTLLYGAGNNGKTLADRFSYDVNEATRLIGFVDDDENKRGLSIAGVRVLGTGKEIEDLIRGYNITKVIITATNMSGEKIREILQITRKFNIQLRIISRRRTGDEVNSMIDREIKLSDLLNRPSKNVDLKALADLVKGKKVLVTGAGGSIGSELARQVLDHEPGRLLILDHSEYNLYAVDRQLRTSSVDVNKVVPLLIDLKDREALFARLKEFNPDVILHAAAYKHVHLVESNPHSAILNNIMGTKNVLDFCEQTGVESFVLISTDKAVNPAGVMGATKRVCEILTTIYAERTKQRFCSVRFGNVLGSSGSLIPLLREQIHSGGPVTVTHKDMVRYFMLIPEAVSLVLKAATIARPGDINVLKMGEPVKILDVAKNLITLMGYKEGDIEIMFTGLRPGEKMYEELYIRGDELKTEHPDILTLPKGDIDETTSIDLLLAKINQMLKYAMASRKEALFELNQIVKSSYVPPESVKEESEQITYLINSPNRRLH